MARPLCPLCGDSLSVVKVSSLARRPLLPQAAAWHPPAAPGGMGRYVLLSVVVALVLYIGTGFAVLCSVLALCAGVIAELVMAWDRADAYETYRQAKARWQTAYYCSTHDRVFGVREPFLCSPERFAALLGRAMADGDEAASAIPASQPIEAVFLIQEKSAGVLNTDALWGTSGDSPAARVA
jgi:hypothetical protein